MWAGLIVSALLYLLLRLLRVSDSSSKRVATSVGGGIVVGIPLGVLAGSAVSLALAGPLYVAGYEAQGRLAAIVILGLGVTIGTVATAIWGWRDLYGSDADHDRPPSPEEIRGAFRDFPMPGAHLQKVGAHYYTLGCPACGSVLYFDGHDYRCRNPRCPNAYANSKE